MTDDTTPAELAAIREQLANGDHRMGVMETQLADNTAVTMEIREILAAARLGFKVLGGIGVAAKWAGGIAAAIVAIWTLILTLKGGK